MIQDLGEPSQIMFAFKGGLGGQKNATFTTVKVQKWSKNATKFKLNL